MVPDDQADLGDQSLVTRLTSLIMVTRLTRVTRVTILSKLIRVTRGRQITPVWMECKMDGEGTVKHRNVRYPLSESQSASHFHPLNLPLSITTHFIHLYSFSLILSTVIHNHPYHPTSLSFIHLIHLYWFSYIFIIFYQLWFTMWATSSNYSVGIFTYQGHISKVSSKNAHWPTHIASIAFHDVNHHGYRTNVCILCDCKKYETKTMMTRPWLASLS